MDRRKMVLAASLLIASGLVLPSVARYTVAAAAPAPADEPHPVIKEAIEELRGTREILVREAARDFKGHRAAAVKHIDAALVELRAALEADRH
jgi:hypothetical protein